METGSSLTFSRFVSTRKRRYTSARNRKSATLFMQAVADVYNKLQRSYKNLCKSYKYADIEAAEDVFGDTLLKCYATIKTRGFIGTYYTTYFTTSLRQNLQNHINKEKNTNRKRNLTLNTKINDSGDEYYTMHVKPNIKDEIVDNENEEEYEDNYRKLVERIKLEKAFNVLPVKFKEILNLRYDGMKYREICRILAIPMTTVKTRLNTARKLLKNTIKKYE